MDEKILLVKVETNRAEFYPPLGLMYLSDALEKAGFHTELWHEREDKLDELKSLVKKENFLLVGFTTLTSPMLVPTIRASKTIHDMGVPVVWGGVHATILPEECIGEEYVDYVVLREGEETMVELARKISKKESVEDIPGIMSDTDQEAHFSPFLNDMDAYRPRWGKIDHKIDRYFYSEHSDWGKRVLPIVTSRGCPYACGFCWNSIVNKRRWRQHSIGYVVSEIERMKEKYHIDGLSIRDANIWADRERAMEIISNAGLPFYTGLRANYIDEDIVEFLEEHKCKHIYVGAESGSDRTLKNISKQVSAGHILRGASLLSRTDIKTVFGFILGFPDETEKDMMRTLRIAERVAEMGSNIEVNVSIFRPYPKVPLWKSALKKGFIVPEYMKDWAKFGEFRHDEFCPWIPMSKLLLMRYTMHTMLGDMKSKNLLKKFALKFVKPLLKARWDKKFFEYPLEGYLIKKFMD